MTTSDKDSQDFLKQVKTLLDDQARALDDRTLAQLRTIRKNSLIRPMPRKHFMPGPAFTLAGSFATIAIIVSFWLAAPVTQNGIVDPIDMTLLSANDDLELYEDLEFYDWLAHEETHT